MKLPPGKLALRVIGLLGFIVSAIWLAVKPDWEPLTALLASVAAVLESIRENDETTNTVSETQALRNRRIMLQRVHDFWIKGVLEQSLHGAVMLELGMKAKKDAVEHLFGLILKTSICLTVLSSPKKDAFNKTDRSML